MSVTGLAELAPGSPVRVVFHHDDGREDVAIVHHTLNEEQIAWFQAGSALNELRATNRSAGSS